jgi:diaminopimelate epimerase
VPHLDDSAILTPMRIDFTKMHGAGNDFIVFDLPSGHAPPSAEQLRKLSDRRTGIGFDQALVLEKPRRPDTAVYYRIFNADGHEVEQCGNGVRCIAALLHHQGRAGSDTFTLDSPAGLIRARVEDPAVKGVLAIVSVDMGIPNFEPRSLPFDASERADSYSLDVTGQRVEIGAVSMGNPHAVLTVDSTERAPVETLGPAIEGHVRFPNRVNAGFVEIVDRSHIRLRVYERGVGETLACGTGACAAVAVVRKRGLLDAYVRVSARGGELRVNWKGPGDNIWLTGPAEIAFEGHVEV